jgi:hypothetical protein
LFVQIRPLLPDEFVRRGSSSDQIIGFAESGIFSPLREESHAEDFGVVTFLWRARQTP